LTLLNPKPYPPRSKAIKHLLAIDLKPRDIMTRAAFENAMVIVIALGVSADP
jgi:dihydroxy-acid dehydratase